jgi:hypothetical protein
LLFVFFQETEKETFFLVGAKRESDSGENRLVFSYPPPPLAMLSIDCELGFAGPIFGRAESSLQYPDSSLHVRHFVYHTQPQSEWKSTSWQMPVSVGMTLSVEHGS